MANGLWAVSGARELWLRATAGTAIVIVLMLVSSQSALAQQGSPPATPARPTVASVSHDSVSITWADPGDSSITGYQVLRRIPKIHDSGVFVVIQEDTGGSDTSYEDTDVEPETKYVYRVKARNAHGLSGRSGFVRTTTPADPTPPNAAPSGQPTISGTAQVGKTLSADTSGISDGNGLTNAQYSYQWVRTHGTSDTDISGATGQTYTLESDDLYRTIKVRVSFTDDDGYSESVTSAATNSVLKPPNAMASGQPTITGTVQVGETLSADTSGISDLNGLTNPQFTFEWLHSAGGVDTVISGATSSTYTVASGDAGYAFKVRVSFTDDDGHSETLTSEATDIVLVTEQQQQQQQQPAESTSEPEDEDFAGDNSTTGWLVVGGYGDGATASLSGGSDIDAFKINLDAGKRYRIDVLTNGPRDYAIGGTYPGKPELQVRELDGSIGTNFERLNGFGEKSPSDTTVANVVNIDGGPDNGARSEFDVSMTGTYLVKVIADGSSSTGTYTVKASEITSEQAFGDFTSGWNGGRIKIDDENAMTGTISEGRDRDWYLALLEAGKCYAFHVKGDHSDADHDGGTLGDPELKIMNFYDYYSMRFYDPNTLEFVGVQDHEETAEYYDMTYINPTHLEILGRADKVCSTVRPYDQPNVSKTICNYYCDDNRGQGKNALIKVRVNTGGEGDYQIGVKGQDSTGTYSVFVEEIDCPSG